MSVDRAAGACIVSGSAEQCVLAGAMIREILEGAQGGVRGDAAPPAAAASGPRDAEARVPVAGFEGRVIGKGGETIRRVRSETGARLDIDRDAGECVVRGTRSAVAAAVAEVTRLVDEGDRRDAGSSRKRAREEEEAPSLLVAKKEEGEPEDPGEDAGEDAGEKRAPPPIEPDFGLSGALAAETNTVNGVALVYVEPPEASKPNKNWRLYCFKDGALQGDPLLVHRRSYYLFGRDRKVADVPTDHPSCSKQHAVLQYRKREAFDEDEGLYVQAPTPYVLDLDSVNGTFLNGEKIEPRRYYELMEKDTIKFGTSTREYVLLHEDSAAR